MHPIYWFCYNLSKLVATIAFDYRAEGKENIPQEGPLLLAMNHQSFLDPPLGGIASDRDIYFLARNTLMDVPLLGKLLPHLNVIPVAREGGDMSALKVIIRQVRGGNGAMIFPEGTRSRDGRLQSAKPGVGLVIAKTLAPVVPMRIFGSYQAFSRTAKKVNCRPVTVVAGPPIQFTKSDFAGDARECYQQASERIMEAITTLQPSPRRMSLHYDDPGLAPG